MTILVTGKSGQVVRALVEEAAQQGVDLGAIGRPSFDLKAPNALIAEILRRAPRVLINAAAYTAVDKAEDDAETARQVNGAAAGALAQACADVGARIIQLSTDYVFSGEKSSPYVENDETGPQSEYGRSKLLGEQLVQQNNANAVILRTAWVFDARGANFVRTMLRLAKAQDEVPVVADQHGCPTFASDLASAILAVATTPGDAGVYHCVGDGETNWADFAEEIFAQASALGGPSARVRRISSSEYPRRARRPANSRLDCGKLANDYGVRMRDWREALRACLDKIAADGWRVE